MRRASESLEWKCRAVVKKLDEEGKGMPRTLIEREIELTLDHIDQLRQHDKKQSNRLTELEFDLKSRMMNLEPLPQHPPSQHWAERMKMINQLKTTLVRLEQQAQRLSLDSHKTLQTLHSRLLELWNMREQVG